MTLPARKKYDYHDIDRGELKLIRIGHSLWSQLKRERRLNPTPSVKAGHSWEDLDQALETIFELKRQYRAELALKRKENWAKIRDRFKK
jgi:hypothetical protein